MKPRKALSLVLCMVAFAAHAASVSIDTIKFAAGSWARSNAALGVRHGRAVSAVEPYEVGGTNGFYAVSLEGGGTVFMSADDDITPVIAFTSASNPDLSEKSLLRYLLEKDIAFRRGVLAADAAAAKKKTAQLSSSSSSVTSSAASSAKTLWAALAPSGQSDPKMLMASASPRTVDAISDIRVPQLVQSLWSQTEDDNGNPCYNYHTPNNYPSGCTATAAGQIMRYWNYPSQELPSITRTCTVNNFETDLTTLGESRIYDWANMKYDPNMFSTEDEREAIGHLLSDIGIALSSDYTKSGTGADPQVLGGLFKDDYEYASGVMYWNKTGWSTGDGGLHTREVRNKIVYANLDAKRPVQFAIYGYDSYGKWAGHAVVCDGYGFVTIGGVETEFAHVNMGWAGTDDMWYNIPEINAANSGAYVGQSGIDFMYLGGAAYNIHPTETGDLLTGRVVEDEEPVSGATVELRDSTGAAIATTTTDEYGVYYFSVAGGATYDVYAVSGDGTKSGLADDVYLPATVEDASTEFAHNVTKAANVGNSWGNDIDIAIPYVRVVSDGSASLYNNLNTALAAAGGISNAVVEIFGPVRLKKPVTLVSDMTICVVPDSASDYPAFGDCPVTVNESAVTTKGWALQIADGVRVCFSNIVFTAESGSLPYIDVLSGGGVSIAGTVGLGVVKTQTADAFALAGAFEPSGAGVSVAYAGTAKNGEQFGVYECSYADALCATNIANALDATFTGSAADGGLLVWDRVSASPAIAVAYATNDTIGVKYYLSMDLLFEDYTNGAEIVVLRDCASENFTNSVTASKSVTIRSEGDAPFTVTAGNSAGFTVRGEGVELVFTNVVFTRSKTASNASFVTVEDGASFTLASGAVIENLSLAGTASAVHVTKGAFAMYDGSAITNCTGAGNANGKGAAVYLGGKDCDMDFAGGTITGCRTGGRNGQNGGGVYAEVGTTVYVSGSATATGNFKGVTGSVADDIYVSDASALVLAGGLNGGEIGVTCANGKTSGTPFATVGEDVDGSVAAMACSHFVNDANAKLDATVSEGGTNLVWAAQPSGPQPVDESEALVRLTVGEASETYATLDDAIEVAGDSAAAFELLGDVELSKSLSILGAKTISGGEGFHALVRTNAVAISVAGDSSLTVTNLYVYGGDSDEAVGRLFDVRDGGRLVFESGTMVESVFGSEQSMVAPIVVWNGCFEMNSGAAITYCLNTYRRTSKSDALTAGAILVYGTKAVASLKGGSITGCEAAGAGAVGVANGATVMIGGDLDVSGNALLSGEESNVVVQDGSSLVLSGVLTGGVGYTEGVESSTNKFGTVDAEFAQSASEEDLVASARRFTHDVTGSTGLVATNVADAADYILIWKTAAGGSNVYTNTPAGSRKELSAGTKNAEPSAPGGEPSVYIVLGSGATIIDCKPFAFTNIEPTVDGKWKLALKPGVAGCKYRLVTSDDLSVPVESWTKVAEKTLAEGDLDGESTFTFEVESSDVKRFWAVIGYNGEGS